MICSTFPITLIAICVLWLIIGIAINIIIRKPFKKVKVGDVIMMSNGVVGKVTKVEEGRPVYVTVEANGITIRVKRSKIFRILPPSSIVNSDTQVQSSESSTDETAETDEEAPTPKTENAVSGTKGREPANFKVIVGFIAIITAYASLIACIVCFVVLPVKDIPILQIILIVLFVALSTVAFFLSVGSTNILALIANIASRPGVLIVYLLMEMVIFIINAIRGSNIKAPSFSIKNEQTIVVYDNGNNRYLKFIEARTDYSGNRGQNYNLYKDDIGIYWRSYDGGNKFIKTGYDDRI